MSKSVFFIVFYILFQAVSYAENKINLSDYFSPTVIKEACDTSQVKFFNTDEKVFFIWMNLLRMAPQRFLKLIEAEGFLNSNSRYALSLKKDLLNQKPVDKPFKSNTLLKKINLSHTQYMIKIKDSNHKGYESRASKVFHSKSFRSGIYGMDEIVLYTDDTMNPLQMLVCFLIDEGVKDLGHRKSILSRQNNYVGLCIIRNGADIAITGTLVEVR